MSDLTIAVFFSRSGGDIAATGLALIDIDLYLTAQNRVTGVDTVVWDGTQSPAEEIDNIGAYIRIYTDADLDTNNYFARGTYTGAVSLDVDTVTGSVGIEDLLPIGTAIEYTYTVLSTTTGLPIEGVRVTISTDAAGANTVWAGDTDAFGVARDDSGYKPRLDAGTYYFWRDKAGYTFVNPDTEVVS